MTILSKTQYFYIKINHLKNNIIMYFNNYLNIKNITLPFNKIPINKKITDLLLF